MAAIQGNALNVPRYAEADINPVPTHGTDTFGSDTDFPIHKETLGGTSNYSAAEERELCRRIDWAILPILMLCYLLLRAARSNIDKGYTQNNGGSDALQAFITEIAFYIAYSLPEPIWNVLLRLLKPKIWLPPCLVALGFFLILTTTAKSQGALATLKFLIGLPAGAIYPGCAFYITCWYPRRQLARPLGIFYAGGTLGIALTNLINAGLVAIPTLNDSNHKWVAIIWGIITILCAVPVYFFLPDFPDEDNQVLRTPKDLEVFERWYIGDDVSRRTAERYRPHGSNAWKQTFTDMKTLLFILMRLIRISQNGLGDIEEATAQWWARERLQKPGDKAVESLLSVPPMTLAVIATIAAGFLADKTSQRGYILIATSVFSIISFMIYLAAPESNIGARYTAGFIGSVGVRVASGLSFAWMAVNAEGLFKRAIVIGLNVGFGNLISGTTTPAIDLVSKSGSASPNVDYKKVGPGYFLGVCFLHLIMIIVTRWYLDRENTKKRLIRTQMSVLPDGEECNVGEGDKSPYFEYLL